MIALTDMERRARSYLRSARILSRRPHAEYDAAAYVCGYAVEIALKARICRTLGWAGYPETSAEFKNLASFKMHDLDTLLHLSGRETQVRSHPKHVNDWFLVRSWNPEQRYAPLGSKTAVEVKAVTEATGRLLRVLL